MTKQAPRRERRAAQVAKRKQQQAATRPAWASPVVLVSVAAVLAGLVLVVVLAFASSTPSSNGGGPIVTPDFPSPPPGLEHGRSLGNPDAPVKIDAWEDFQCPVCRRFSLEIEPQLIFTYITSGKVYLTYHDLAFIGQESFDAASAARISDAIGPGFWPMHDLLFANQGAENSGAFSRDRLASMAAQLGMNRTAFLEAMNDPTYRQAVALETQQGGAAGISQTPTLVINGKAYAGLPTWQNLSALIDAAAGSGAAPSPGAVPSASPSGP